MVKAFRTQLPSLARSRALTPACLGTGPPPERDPEELCVCSLLKLQAVLWKPGSFGHSPCSVMKVSFGHIDGKWDIFMVLGPSHQLKSSLSRPPPAGLFPPSSPAQRLSESNCCCSRATLDLGLACPDPPLSAIGVSLRPASSPNVWLSPFFT